MNILRRSNEALAVRGAADKFSPWLRERPDHLAPPLHEAQRILAMLACFCVKTGKRAHFPALKEGGDYVRIEKSDAMPMG